MKTSLNLHFLFLFHWEWKSRMLVTLLSPFPSPFPFPATSLTEMQPSGCLLQHGLLDVSFGIWSWFYDFSIIPLHFLYVSFASLELLLHQ